MKRWVFVFVVVALAAVALGTPVVLASLHRKETSATHDICRVCGSTRVRRRTVVDGVERRASGQVNPSAVFADLLDARRHAHDWVFASSTREVREGFRCSFGIG